MRISDWSSDVCSSDLGLTVTHSTPPQGALGGDRVTRQPPTCNGNVDEATRVLITMVGMAKKRRAAEQPAWTPNQIVAHNISKARMLRSWTQDQAAEACAPYLGARLSPASWSALERSVDRSDAHTAELQSLM